MSWNEAEAFCQQKNGHLASITSNSINQYVLEGLTSRGVVGFTWLGGNDIDKEGTWRWTDGSAFDFTAWYLGEPNNKIRGPYVNGEDCLHVPDPADHRWNDYFCSAPAAFICGKKKSQRGSSGCLR